MRIEIQLRSVISSGEDTVSAQQEKPLRVELQYDGVRIEARLAGQSTVESAAEFLARPYLERYKLFRDGRVTLLRKGTPLDLATALAEARAVSNTPTLSGAAESPDKKRENGNG